MSLGDYTTGAAYNDGYGNQDVLQNINAVVGSSHDDTIWGVSSAVTFTVNLSGGAGNDALCLRSYFGTARGGAGDDILDASGARTSARNTLDGGLGDDRIIGKGGSGKNTITGGDGRDWISAVGGADTIDGGDGCDFFSLAGYMSADDYVSGGADADVFYLGSATGDVTIQGFDVLEDTIVFNPSCFAGSGTGVLDKAPYSPYQSGDDVIIRWGTNTHGLSVRIEDVQLSELDILFFNQQEAEAIWQQTVADWGTPL